MPGMDGLRPANQSPRSASDTRRPLCGVAVRAVAICAGSCRKGLFEKGPRWSVSTACWRAKTVARQVDNKRDKRGDSSPRSRKGEPDVTLTTTRFSRRAALEGIGTAALGLGSAALLGCGSTGGGGTGSVAAEKSGQVAGATSGGGLPMNAPKVTGTIKPGGTWTVSGGAETEVESDAGTARGGNIWHKISEKGLEPDPVTGEIRPHVFTSWEIADKQGLQLVLKLHPKLFMAPENRPPWNGRQFTAQDAAWNLERIRGLYAERLKIPLAQFQRASLLEGLTKAEAVDNLTVKVTLSKPNSAFFNGLWETRVPFMPREMDDIGYTDRLKMAGPGPFYTVEWVNDVRTRFAKIPRYNEFRKSEPYFD